MTLVMTGGLTPLGLSDSVEAVMFGLLAQPADVHASTEMLYSVNGVRGDVSPSSIRVDLLCTICTKTRCIYVERSQEKRFCPTHLIGNFTWETSIFVKVRSENDQRASDKLQKKKTKLTAGYSGIRISMLSLSCQVPSF